MAMSFINKPEDNKSGAFTRFTAMQPSALTGGRDENTNLIRSGSDLLAATLQPLPAISAGAALVMGKEPLFAEVVQKVAQTFGMEEQATATPGPESKPTFHPLN